MAEKPAPEAESWEEREAKRKSERDARISEYIELTDWFTEFIDTTVAELQDKAPGTLGDQYLISLARQAARSADPEAWARLRRLEVEHSRIWV